MPLPSYRPTSLVSVLGRVSDWNLWLAEPNVAVEEYERKRALITRVIEENKMNEMDIK
jgi:hypothetical protein